jgi:hypothetical protein
MFGFMLAGDTEEGTVGSILTEFHQSCILKVCSVLFFQKILIHQKYQDNFTEATYVCLYLNFTLN